jgi:hypothetical protein
MDYLLAVVRSSDVGFLPDKRIHLTGGLRRAILCL